MKKAIDKMAELLSEQFIVKQSQNSLVVTKRGLFSRQELKDVMRICDFYQGAILVPRILIKRKRRSR